MAQPWTDTEVEIDGVHFRIGKLLPMEAFALIEQIRPGLVESVANAPADAGLGSTVVGVLGGFPPAHMAHLRKTLFTEVTFSSPATNGYQPLTDNEELAFMDLTAMHIYELIGRAFTINFHDSWDALLSRIPQAATVLGSPLPNTSISNLSSAIP